MNEDPPPPPPEDSAPPPPRLENDADLPSRGTIIGLGIGLFIACAILAIPTKGFSFIIGFALGCLGVAFPGYRYILVSYILTGLILVGVVALVVVIACSGHPGI